MAAAGPGAATGCAGGAPPLRDYAIDVWTSRNGLPHNSLRDIAQTPEGHLWFATWEGLVRYNGLDFTVFDRSTRPGLRDNGIGALFVDRQGGLWISDSRGNVSHRGSDGQWRVWEHQADTPQVLIQSMQMDSQGRLWLLYEGKGIGYLTPDSGIVYRAPAADLPMAMSFTRLVVDAQDRVWVGTLDGLVLRDNDGVLKRAPAAWGWAPALACRGRTARRTARCGSSPASACTGWRTIGWCWCTACPASCT